MRRRIGIAITIGVLLCLGGHRTAAQGAVESAISFYAHGGAYCFRIAPFGVSLSEETEWTVMVLTSAANHRNTFRIRSLDPGDTGLRGAGLMTAGRFANDVWKFDRTRAEFFDRFAQGMADGQLRARVVRIDPSSLGAAASERARAETYLKFADRGSRVSFEKVRDLAPDEFRQYADYFPD
jgi:hypothetical protein